MASKETAFASPEKFGGVKEKIALLSREVHKIMERKEKTGRIPYIVLLNVIREYYGLSELIVDCTGKDSADRKELRGRLDEVRPLLVQIGAL